MKNAIAVLTRGYDNIKDYNNLIIRNQCVALNFYFKVPDPYNYDILIFHEGNITSGQQRYIQEQTPLLPMSFIPVKFYDGSKMKKNYELCAPNKKTDGMSNGYKNMCYFWSIDFMEYMKDYDYMIRVDEDCHLKELDPNIIEEYRKTNIYFSSGFYQKTIVNERNQTVPGIDYPETLTGMKELFDTFVKEFNITPFNANVFEAPYTNVMIVCISYFRNNRQVQELLHRIKKSNCIFSNRWGDLPIWGYILSYFVEPRNYKKEPRIRYYHGSHGGSIENLEYRPGVGEVGK
jgi:hypothetical protein